MAKKERFEKMKGFVERRLDTSRRLDLPSFKYYTDYLIKLAKKLFIPGSATQSGDFDDAVEKFHVSDELLNTDCKALIRMTYFCLTLGLMSIIYAIYLFSTAAFQAGVLALVVFGVAIALAFRYHFWRYQIIKRKLGCTFREWYNDTFRGGVQ